MVIDEIISPQEAITHYNYCLPYGFTLYVFNEACPSGQIIWEFIFGIIIILFLI